MTLKIPSSSKILHTYTPPSRLLTPFPRGLFSFPREFYGLQVSDLGHLCLLLSAQPPSAHHFPNCYLSGLVLGPLILPAWLSTSAHTSTSLSYCAPPILLALQPHGSALSSLTQGMECSIPQAPIIPLVGGGVPKMGTQALTAETSPTFPFSPTSFTPLRAQEQSYLTL